MNVKPEIVTLSFEAYGVRVSVSSRDADALDSLRRRLETSFPPGELRILAKEPRAPRRFSIRSSRSAKYAMFAGRRKVTHGNDWDMFLNFLAGRLRLLVAEFAVDCVFVHAGVVGWNGAAIVIPGRSHSGKTSLVAELVKAGAVYYSDEYAVIGRDGLVRPFATDLAVRLKGTGDVQTDLPVRAIGGVTGTAPIPVGMIIFSQYMEGHEFSAAPLTVGQGILEVLPHTIPVTERPEFSLKLLNLATSHAIILKSERGEADIATQKILKLLEKHMS